MTIERFWKLVRDALAEVDSQAVREALTSYDVYTGLKDWYSKLFRKDFAPRPGETVAVVAEKPMTASLFFDRVVSVRGRETVPEKIRAKLPTSFSLLQMMLSVVDDVHEEFDKRYKDNPQDTRSGMLAAMIVSPTIKLLKLSNPGIVASIFEAGGEPPDFDRLLSETMIRIQTKAIQDEFGIPARSFFSDEQEFNKAYTEGDVRMVVSSLENLHVVDEDRLSWPQVLQFRKDSGACRSIRRLMHWYDTCFPGKSLSFIVDEVGARTEDYAAALKKHGIKTAIGSMSAVLDGKFVLGTSAASVGLAGLTQDPVLGALLGGLLLAGKVAVFVAERMLKRAEIASGTTREIAFVHELKRRFSAHRRT